MMKNRRLNEIIGGTLCLLLLCVVSVFAQTSTATLNGTVTDEKEAVVPGATVKIINLETGFERTVVTNADGTFSFPLLPPNTYRLAVDRAGFDTFVVPELVLNTNDQRSLSVRLRVGQVGAAVEVTAESQTVNQNPATSTVVDQTFVQNIPLNGRTIQSLITLTPGVVVGTGDGQLSFNGQRTNSNYLTIDGVSGNIGIGQGGGAVPVVSARLGTTGGFDQNASGANPGYNLLGGTNNLFSIEELQEINLQTSNTTAAYGRQAGGQIATTTRSGTNEFRGTIYDYWRHERFAARDFFTNASPTPIPKQRLRQHNFGIFLSGPVVLPGFGEGTPFLWKGTDRTFFYFNYEGLRLTQPQAATVLLVPSTQFRNQAILHPRLRTILNAFPRPTNETAAGCPTRILNGDDDFNNSPDLPLGLPISTCYTDSASSRTELNAFRFKIDHRFNDNNTISFRFNRSPITARNFVGSVLTRSEQTITTVTANYRTVFSAKAVNEFNINWSRNATSASRELTDTGGATPFDASLLLPSNAPANSSATFALAGQLYPTLTVGRARENNQSQWNFTDNFRYVARNHSLGFGIDFRRVSPLLAPSEYSTTQVGLFLEDLTAAAPLIFQVSTFAADPVKLRYDNFSAYAQDTWQASKRLTLDFGLRWEVNTPPKGENVQLYTLKGFPDLNNLTLSTDPFFETDYTSFAPRVGAAFQLNQRQGWETILRGGYGLYYDLGQGTLSTVAAQFPYFRRLPASRLFVPFPISDANLAPPAPANLNGPYAGQGFTLVAPDYALPRTHQWSFSVDQSIGGGNVVTASYVANAGRRLLRRYFYGFAPAVPPAGNTLPVNSRFPNASLNVTRNDGDFGDESDYQSLQIQYVRRLTRGFQILTNYTLSKSEDTGSSDSTGAVSTVNLATGNALLPENFRGFSDFDRRHIFNAAVTYELPAWKFENRARRLLNNIFVKGWATDFNFKYQSAAPLSVTYNYVDSNSGITYTYLADIVPGQNPWLDDAGAPGGRRLNPAAFRVPPQSLTTNISQVAPGNSTRNGLRGFDLYQLDFSLRRTFSITERLKLKFRAEAFNVTNRPNFSPPVSVLGSVQRTSGTFLAFPEFGRSRTIVSNPGQVVGNVNGGLSSIYAIGGPRTMQFSLKVEF